MPTCNRPTKAAGLRGAALFLRSADLHSLRSVRADLVRRASLSLRYVPLPEKGNAPSSCR
ncbi:MAG: hypothetical protein ABJN57_07950 [Hyphomicrobiales bacterium]